MDHVFSGFAEWPSPGSEVFTEDYVWELGGGAIATACALALLGRKVHLIGLVGKGERKAIAERLASFHVSANGLIVGEGRSGITVSISTASDRTFFTYRGVNQGLTSYLVTHPELVQQASTARHIHLAFPLEASVGPQLLSSMKAQGATISLDVGHHVEWLRNAESWQLLRAVDYVMPNEKEAAMLAGSSEAYLELCRQHGVEHALVKLGPAGAAMIVGSAHYRASPPDVALVDTTGAGDAFNAGFIDALLSGHSPQQCLQHGCVCGALSTRAAGALQALPTRAETEAALEEFYAT